MSVRQGFIFISILVSLSLLMLAATWPFFYWGFTIVGPVILLGVHNMLQKQHTILRIYPVIGMFRYLFEIGRAHV